MRALIKTILVAHRQDDVRRRFAAALADAPYTLAVADSASQALAEIGARDGIVHLALIDAGLASDPAAFLQAIRRTTTPAAPVLLFASTVPAARQVVDLAALGVAGYLNDHVPSPQILQALAPYLFPDNFNRRTSPRVSLGVPISYRAGQTIAGAVTLDVGKGGLAVRTMTPLPPGTAVQVKFRLPGTPSDLEASGRVVWSDRKVGMGLSFETVEPADQATIDAFVDAHLN